MGIKKIVFLFLGAVIVLAGCAGTGSADGKARDFSLQNLNDKTVRLSDYNDKVVILNFFATWCPPCRAEVPDFVELMDEYGDKGLVIIGVSLDTGGVKAVGKFADQYKINYPVLMDDGIVSKAYGPIQAIPTTFIIDRNKNIAQKIVGSRKKDYFEGVVKPLL